MPEVKHQALHLLGKYSITEIHSLIYLIVNLAFSGWAIPPSQDTQSLRSEIEHTYHKGIYIYMNIYLHSLNKLLHPQTILSLQVYMVYQFQTKILMMGQHAHKYDHKFIILKTG